MAHTLAIIGFGGMGGYHFEKVTELVEGIRVKGAYDIQPDIQQKIADKGLVSYPTLEALLEDPEVDLVTVATPNNFHKDLVIRALRSGKNVVCEKPVAMNAAELEEMIAVAKETGKLFSIHQNRRWDRDYNIIKRLVKDNTIGQPYFIESRVQGSRKGMFGWRKYKINGGGMLLDWGVHLIDQVMDLIDSPVVSVDGHLQSVFTDEVDDNIKAFLRFENGTSALIEVSTNCFINLPRWHVSCEDGTAVVEDWACHSRMVQLATDEEMEWTDDIVYTEAGPTRTMAPRPAETTRELPLPDVHPQWTDYYCNIVDVIDGKAELIVKPEQALRVMKVIDLLFASEQQKTGISCRI